LREEYESPETFRLLVENVRDLEQKECYHMEFHNIYPAVVRLGAAILKDISQKAHKKDVQKVVKEVINALVYTPLEEAMTRCLQE
jgi:hypothetical protein